MQGRAYKSERPPLKNREGLAGKGAPARERGLDAPFGDVELAALLDELFVLLGPGRDPEVYPHPERMEHEALFVRESGKQKLFPDVVRAAFEALRVAEERFDDDEANVRFQQTSIVSR